MYIETDIDNNIITIIKIGLPPALQENNWHEIDNIPEDVLHNIFSYKYIDEEFVLKENADELKLQKLREAKIQSMSEICHKVIISGFDHSDGHHYSLQESDQNSLNVLSIKASQGFDTTWHYDGGLCQFYSPEEMLALTEYAFKFITYHQTYFNQLKAQINNMDNIDQIIVIKYGEQLINIYNENLKMIVGDFQPSIELFEDPTNYNVVLYDIDIPISCDQNDFNEE